MAGSLSNSIRMIDDLPILYEVGKKRLSLKKKEHITIRHPITHSISRYIHAY